MQREDYIRQVVEACHRLHAKGLTTNAGGSFSLRIPGGNAIALVPSGTDFSTVGAAQVEIIALGAASPAGVQTADAGDRQIHRSIYGSRADVGAIVHSHQKWASGLRLLRQTMPGIFDEQVRQLGRRVERLPYSAPELAPEAIARLRNHDNVFLFGDGVLCLGVTGDRAVFNAELIEKCAKAFILAVATGCRIGTVPLLVREIAQRRMRKDQQRAAAAYRRGEIPSGFTAY